MTKMGARSYKKSRKIQGFSGLKKEGFLIKCGPVWKRPNLEQTLAGRIRTKGSDVWKMLFFCVVACQKREPKRGQEKDRKLKEKGRKSEPKWS